MANQFQNKIFNNKNKYNNDEQDVEICVNRTTILRSPFITTDTSSNLPKLMPPSRKHSSPVKRTHKRLSSLDSSSIDTNSLYSRTRKPLSFTNPSERSFSLLDDFQSDNSKSKKNDIFSSQFLLPPPQNSNLNLSTIMNNIYKENDSNTVNNRDFFDLHVPSSTKQSSNKTESTFLLSEYSNAYDFNSYLRQVTSNLSLGSENMKISASNKYSLDLTNPIKIDLNQASDKSIFDNLELDCVVRSSVWDSDVETEDEDDMNINLNLNLKKDERNNLNNINYESDDIQATEKQKYEDLECFNQPILNKNESQIPLLYDPINKMISSKRTPISFKQIDSSSIPIKIYSDSQQSKIRSPISSQDSDETLHEHDQLKKTNITLRKRVQLDSNALLKNNNTKEISEEFISSSLPHHHIFAENLKPALKPIPRTLLNMIVESSDGSLEDATKYATEINAQNSQGIPIPEKTTEIVNIPTTGPSVNGVKKSAIIRGVRAKSNIKRKNNNCNLNTKEKIGYFNTLTERRAAMIQENQNKQNLSTNVSNSCNSFRGFYSLQERQQFMKRNIATNDFANEFSENKENHHSTIIDSNESKMTTMEFSNGFKRPRINESTFSKIDSNGRKRVDWADSLEW